MSESPLDILNTIAKFIHSKPEGVTIKQLKEKYDEKGWNVYIATKKLIDLFEIEELKVDGKKTEKFVSLNLYQ